MRVHFLVSPLRGEVFGDGWDIRVHIVAEAAGEADRGGEIEEDFADGDLHDVACWFVSMAAWLHPPPSNQSRAD